MAPKVADQIEAAIEAGQLRVLAGRIRRISPAGEAAEAEIKPRGVSQTFVRIVQKVVNCSGPNYDFSSADDVFLKRLLHKGRIRADRHKLGLRVAENFGTIDVDGQISDDLFAVGPMLRGQLWGTNAVPEIVMQAEALAQRLWHRGLSAPAQMKAVARG